MTTELMATRRRARTPWQSVRHLWDLSSIYLPVLLMGLLALGSYWLLRATPEQEAPQPQRPVTHEPDYFMRNFAVKTFTPDGSLKSEVKGTEARHYPDTDTLEIDNARIRSVGPSGQPSTAQADLVTTNADQSEIVLRGNAVVVREATPATQGPARPRVEFRGEFLHVYVDEERIESDRPVLLLRGRDRLSANSLRYDDATRVAQLAGRVRATLAARP